MPTMPNQYYDRFNPEQNYEEHLFIAGRALQSAELNEIQKNSAYRLRSFGDALFRDGDIIRDASVVVNEVTGFAQCASGALYIRGAVRGVAPAEFTVPTTGELSIGIRLLERVVTALEDPSLRDPATGTRNYNEPGAERLEVVPSWSWSGDEADGEFFPVYTVIDGVLSAKEPPPNLDAVTQALARYDRDSAGGTYVVSGLRLQQLPDVDGKQVYSLSEGRARVFGYGIELATSRRLTYEAVPDLKLITNEPHLSSTAGAQRINFSRTPGANITAVSITTEKTVTLTHGVSTGAQDPLPDTSVLQILNVSQGAQVYTQGVDYQLTAGRVDWSLAGAEPAPGSTYSVTYQYITLTEPTDVDDNGFTVTGAVVGTLVLVTYYQKLPRFDRLCLSSDGRIFWVAGVASDYYPQLPSVPSDLLPVATVRQTWTSTRSVLNDSVRVVPMPQLAAVDGRIDLLAQLIAQQRLESNIHTREAGAKKGLFTDPFLDESQRDAGTPQNAAIVNGVLMLPIEASISFVSADVITPATLTYNNAVAIEQPLRTGSMKINPYMAFTPVPATLRLTPNVDRWTVVQTDWASASTARFVVDAVGEDDDDDLPRTTQSTRNALIATNFSQIETLRPITVNFSVEGFGPGEALTALRFDGISLPTGGLTANASGLLSGTFTIPEGVPAGNKAVEIVGAAGSAGEASFSGQGTLERRTWQSQTTITETRWQSPPPPPRVTVRRVDPLAQTFTLPANTQISAVELWFAEAPTTMARVQIRATAVGFPTQDVLAEQTVPVGSVLLGGAHTRITFEAPVTLLGGIEYALVVLCDDPVGSLSVAELGKFDANAQRWITSQPYTIGVLLSSSNASTWTPAQDRDMAFRILRASYTEAARQIPLGNVPVSGATDLLLMSFADRPSSATSVEYTLTLPDASVVTVTDGQPVQLPAPITGNIAVQANLTGTTDFSPVLMPGTQLVSGQIASTGTYVSRAIPAGSSSTIKVIYEGIVPSGATIAVAYKGQEPGDTWVSIPVTANNPADGGYTEFIHTVTGVSEVTAQIRLILSGGPAARPYVRDLRVIVL